MVIRRAHAVCPTAAPLAIRVWWISHARGLYAASAQYPWPEVNAASADARAAVVIAWARSSAIRVCACVSAASAAAAAAASQPSPARTISSASLAEAGAAVPMRVTSLRGDRRHAGFTIISSGSPSPAGRDNNTSRAHL